MAMNAHVGLLQNMGATDETSADFDETLQALKDASFILWKEVQALPYSRTIDFDRGIRFYDEVRKFEIDLIRRALQETNGHQTRAAQLLGLNLTTLNAKIKQFNIHPDDLPDEAAASSSPLRHAPKQSD